MVTKNEKKKKSSTVGPLEGELTLCYAVNIEHGMRYASKQTNYTIHTLKPMYKSVIFICFSAAPTDHL